MFRSDKPNIAPFRTDYASHADFCDVFRNDMRSLYLLAFLLTANHEESERCFVSTVEEAFKDRVAVRKEWARSWVKLKLIENAIEIVSLSSARNGQKRDLWGAGPHEAQREYYVDAVTRLAPFERFVFVMSTLERYSNRECSLLLGCSLNKVAEARTKALLGLADLAALLPRGDGLSLRRQCGGQVHCSPRHS